MAELASRAIVSSLLGLLQNDALLLSRVGGDVKFIKAEMESMHSFLEHLSRTAPPAGGHDEQVRTWMKQVRELAHDCGNCIDLYLRRGDSMIYRAKGGRWRYLWWITWLSHKLVAQHDAAVQLRELKERALDVSQRRLRYGVEVPKGYSSAASSLPSSSQRAASAAAAAQDDDDEDDKDVHNQAAAAIGSRLLEPCLVEEFSAEKLSSLLMLQAGTTNNKMASIGIVTPDDTEDSGAIARESLALVAKDFDKTVWINLPAVHYSWDRPLLPSEILFYIMCGIKGWDQDRRRAYRYKEEVMNDILDMINNVMKVGKRIEEIKRKIGIATMRFPGGGDNNKKVEETCWSLFVHALTSAADAECHYDYYGHGKESEEVMATILKSYIEKYTSCYYHLDTTQYIATLQKVFLTMASKPPQTVVQEGTTRLGDDHIKAIIENQKITQFTLGIIWELLQKPQLPGRKSATGIQPHGGGDQVTHSAAAAAAAAIKEALWTLQEISWQGKATSAADPVINETKEKMDEISEQINNQLLIKVIVDRIKVHLGNKKTMIILQDDEDYLSRWEEIANALNLLGCAAGSAVIVSTSNAQKAKEVCNLVGEPIICSLVGHYHDIVLQLTQHREYVPQILRDILDRCHPHEFCMKLFAQALYANPNRSYDELIKLSKDLAAQKTLVSDATRMIDFSYSDLPREYKTCLLYLAIFPQGHNIRRSTLIGRWVTEGLIANEHWGTAVRRAERCFDALIKRGLVLPRHVGTAGKVKSCMVGHQVHGFITKIAKKEHIVDARLSDQLARHFSIFSGLQLRASDGINKFLRNLLKDSSQLLLLKVLDLEGANYLHKNRYLKDICINILLLKYLSLRRTNIKHLPSEINNLSELEVLDIRQTLVRAHATRDVLLLKLRRFLAVWVYPSSEMNGESLHSAVRIPRKIEKMKNLEVLSNVRASRAGSELNDIRHLWKLRKLGVVIQDKKEHLYNFLRVISDLKECLQSLSVTISDTRRKSSPSSSDEQLKDMCSRLRKTPKHLESLTLNGVTESVQLLDLLAKGSEELAEVTLSGTLLKQEDLSDVLGVVPKLHCLRLRHGAYNGRKLTFKKEEFLQLKYFLVEGTSITDRKESMNKTDIEFEHGATVELEKIVLSFTDIRSLAGIDNLPGLKELELEGNEFLHSFSQGDAPEEYNESIAPEQNTRNGAPQQNMESRALEQNTESITLEQSTQSIAPEPSITEIRTLASRFIFKKGKFKHLKYFHLEDSKVTNITFEDGSAPELKKITLSLNKENSSLAGVECLPKLKEMELRGSKFVLVSLFYNANKVAKVTLRDTYLKQEDMKILGNKPNLRCLVLLDKSYDECKPTFNKDEFPKLDLLIIECTSINSISFTNGSAPKLEKIVWFFIEMKSLSGINNLPILKEIECYGDLVPYHVRKDIAAHTGQPVLTHKKPQHVGTPAEDDDTRFPWISCFLKNKNWR